MGDAVYMVARDVEDELRGIEATRLAALVERNLDLAERLRSDDYVLITPRGGPLSKAEYLGAIQSGELVYRRFDAISDVEVLTGADTLTALRYRAAIEVGSPGGDFVAICWHTDCYRLGST